MPLLKLLEKNSETLKEMSIEQIVSTAGDGKLRDNSEAQSELREFLLQTEVDLLSSYVDHCLNVDFADKGLVLQDIVNELGRRLEYDVQNGKYRGSQKSIGYDGIWKDPSGHNIVVEVKTSTWRAITLKTLNDYRNKLLESGEISKPSSILIVVGRIDTEDLEAQVRGSRFAWDVRIISVASLLNLVRIKLSTESADTIEKIRRLITPIEYTRLDSLVDVVFSTTVDVEESTASESSDKIETLAKEVETVSHGDRQYELTPGELIHAVRNKLIDAIGNAHGTKYIKKSRALFWNRYHEYRVVCTISKRYETKGTEKYWYAYHPQWHEFLNEGERGTFLLGCMEIDKGFAIPVEVMEAHLDEFNKTVRKRDGKYYYHIKIKEDKSGNHSLLLPQGKSNLRLDDFAIEINISDLG